MSLQTDECKNDSSDFCDNDVSVNYLANLHNSEPSTSEFIGSNLSKNINNIKDCLPNLSLNNELIIDSETNIQSKLSVCLLYNTSDL